MSRSHPLGPEAHQPVCPSATTLQMLPVLQCCPLRSMSNGITQLCTVHMRDTQQCHSKLCPYQHAEQEAFSTPWRMSHS